MVSQKLAIIWIFAVGVTVTLAGFFLAIIVPAFFPFIQDVFYGSFASGQSVLNMAGPDLAQLRWLYGLLGALMFGWGVMIALLAARLLKENAAWIWHTIVVSVLAWFVVDSGISLFYQVYINALLNSAILILTAIPYLMRRPWQK